MSPSPLCRTALKLTNLNSLKQFHAHLIHLSLSRNNSYVWHLIAACTRLQAPLSYTRSVFDSASHPDALTFTTMLKYYSIWGAHSDIFCLFDQMRKFGFKPDISLYPIVIKAAGKDGIILHSQLVKMCADSDKYVRNALVNMYGKHGPIGDARAVFDELTEKSTADWNAMISGYWNWGSECEAKGLFDAMLDCNRNVITWTVMVTGYSKMKNLEKARSYFDQMPKRSLVSWNAMLSGYAQNGLYEEALSLFNQMGSMGVRPNDTTWVAVISSCSSSGDPHLAESIDKMLDDRGIRTNPFVKSALLDMYAKCGRTEMARNCFDDLGVNRNLVTWNAMISGYMKTGDMLSARELFDQMLEKDAISWNTMIAGYAQNGESSLAIDLFKEMVNGGSVPDEVTMVSVISACGHLGAMGLGNWIVEFITANRIKLSPRGYNSLIFMHSRCGSMYEAKMIFQSMETRDVVSYNALITGFAAHGDGIEALELMEKMKNKGIEPDRISYIGVLTACSHAGMLEEGRKIFESIQAPDVDHYACLVDLFGRAGKLDEAKGMMEKMPMHPHGGMYGSLLNASRVHRRIDLGEFAANKLFELEPENSGNYVLLSNTYASAGMWDKVGRIRNFMRTRGLTKTTGWSLVEHDGKMHRFIAGDYKHERSVDIYNLLAELKRKLQVAGYVADKSSVLRDIEEEEKEETAGTHSEKIAVAFCLLVNEPRTVIRVVKNLRICCDCHTTMKLISKLEKRKIIVRDNNRFHSFNDNACSCNDYW